MEEGRRHVASALRADGGWQAAAYILWRQLALADARNQGDGMSDLSTPESNSYEESLQLFWRTLGRSGSVSPEDDDTARRIVVAVDKDSGAVALAADFARDFDVALPNLADELESPSAQALRLTPQRPMGEALIAGAAVQRGQVSVSTGDLVLAERYFRWAAQRFHALGERAAESTSLTLIGRVAQMRERFAEASAYYQESMAIDQALGSWIDVGVSLGLLGQVAWLEGRFDDAERLALQALALHRSQSDWRNAISTLSTLVEVAKERGQPWRAWFYSLRRALATFRLL